MSTLIVAAMIGAYALWSALAAIIALAVMAVTTGAYWNLLGRSREYDKLVIVGLPLILLATLPVAAFRSETAILHFFVATLSLTTGYLITRNLIAFARAVGLVTIISQALIIVYLVAFSVGPRPLETLLPESSSNIVTGALIVLQGTYTLARFVAHQKSSVPTALVTLVICIIGFGRGSIAAAAALVTLNMALLVLRGSSLRILTMILVSVVAMVWVAQKYGGDITQLAITSTKFGHGLSDVNRATIWSEYTKRIDHVTLLTGIDYGGTEIEAMYNSNPHSSLLRAHHIFGLPYVGFLFLFVAGRILFACGSLKLMLLASGVLAAILFRSLTDSILFPTTLDALFFATCFALGHPIWSWHSRGRLIGRWMAAEHNGTNQGDLVPATVCAAGGGQASRG